MVEHNNKFVKEMIANQIANVSFDSSQLVSRAFEGIEAVLTNIDLSLRMESGKHAKVDKRKDVYAIAHRILDGKMTEYCPGRAYKNGNSPSASLRIYVGAVNYYFKHPGAIRLKWARPPMDIQ